MVGYMECILASEDYLIEEIEDRQGVYDELDIHEWLSEEEAELWFPDNEE